jgi:hypothetical protein
MELRYLEVEREGEFTVVTMARPEKRNALRGAPARAPGGLPGGGPQQRSRRDPRSAGSGVLRGP